MYKFACAARFISLELVLSNCFEALHSAVVIARRSVGDVFYAQDECEDERTVSLIDALLRTLEVITDSARYD